MRKGKKMREILFRGKTYDGKWEQGDLRHGGYVHNDSETYIMKSDYALHNIPVDPKTVGQFTGLTDKNGKRIFEGDILRDVRGRIYKVFFTTTSCGFMVECTVAPNEYETGRYRLGKAYCDAMVVIGNIHDNPEELKGGSENGRLYGVPCNI